MMVNHSAHRFRISNPVPSVRKSAAYENDATEARRMRTGVRTVAKRDRSMRPLIASISPTPAATSVAALISLKTAMATTMRSRSLFRRVGEKADLMRSSFMRGIHRFHRAIERHLILGVHEHDALRRRARHHLRREEIPQRLRRVDVLRVEPDAVVLHGDDELILIRLRLRRRHSVVRRNFVAKSKRQERRAHQEDDQQPEDDIHQGGDVDLASYSAAATAEC